MRSHLTSGLPTIPALEGAHQLQESASAIKVDVIGFRDSHLLSVYNDGIADPSFVLEQTVGLAADVFDRAARLSLALGYYWYSLRYFTELTEYGTVWHLMQLRMLFGIHTDALCSA